MYGNDGVVLTGDQSAAQTVALLPDGRLLVLSYGGSFSTKILTRYNVDGTLDRSFGTAGSVLLSLSGPAGLALQRDGKVLIASSSINDDTKLVRLNSDGTVDAQFRVDQPTPSTRDNGYFAALQSDGRIVLLGVRDSTQTFNYQLDIRRYLDNGQPDTSFSQYGLTIAGGVQPSGLFVSNDGKILAIGSAVSTSTTSIVAMARFDSSGALDATFGDAGKVQTTLGASTRSTSAALQSDGKIVVVGGVSTNATLQAMVLRYGPNGVLDSGFASAGAVLLDLEGYAEALDVALQPDGKILVCGFSRDKLGESTLFIVRLTAEGHLDPAFAKNGLLLEAHSGADSALDMVLQPDGKIVIAGVLDGKIALVRYMPDGTRDDGAINNRISGTEIGDTITGSDANDQIYALAGNDTVYGSGGDDRIDGGAGRDMAVIAIARAECTVEVANSEIRLSNRTGYQGVDTLVNVERIKFNDGYLAFDTDGAAGQAYRLYQAAFARVPDVAGLGFQMTALDNGVSLHQVAQNFIDSPEFARTYGALDDNLFVIALYLNVLHRLPDVGGLAFHLANLANKINTRADVLVGFSESPENQAALIGSIQHGMVYTLI